MSSEKVVLVTGASSGIGRATAATLASRGHSLAAASIVHAYDQERSRAAAAVNASIEHAPDPQTVAEEISQAIDSPYRMRRPVGPRAKLLSRLRRYMPPGPVDRQLRKTFALDA